MRITDLAVRLGYLSSYNRVRTELAGLREQISTQTKINRPSDAPGEVGVVMRLQNQLKDIVSYKKNIDSAYTQVNTTISDLNAVLDEIEITKQQMTELKNDPVQTDLLPAKAEMLTNAINSLLQRANSQFEGKYLFGGNDTSKKPFTFDTLTNQYVIQSNDIYGKQNVMLGKGIEANIAVNGAELFSSVVKQAGSFSRSEAVGWEFNNSQQIYDADGNVYSFNLKFTKTAANNFTVDYNIQDSSAATVMSDSKSVVFDATTGALQSVGGSTPNPIKISVPGQKLQLIFDFTSLNESITATTSAVSLNAKADILNTLHAAKENLKAGIRPTLNQFEVIEGFSKVVLQKLTEAGNILNKVDDTETVNQNSNLELSRLLSKRNDVDMASALVDLQHKEYQMDALYKVSSMLLPKSLLDFI